METYFASRSTKLINSDQLGSTRQAFGRSKTSERRLQNGATYCRRFARTCWKNSLERWQRREESNYLPSSRFTTAEREKTSFENRKMTQCGQSDRAETEIEAGPNCIPQFQNVLRQ